MRTGAKRSNLIICWCLKPNLQYGLNHIRKAFVPVLNDPSSAGINATIP